MVILIASELMGGGLGCSCCGNTDFHSIFMPDPSSYLCSETVVDGLGKAQIFIQCSCLNAPLCGYMNWLCEEPGCSLQSLEGRPLIGYYAALFNVITSTF